MISAEDPLDDLVVRSRDGEVRAFEVLYRRLAPSVASYLRWHGVADVDGVTNEVFSQVHRNLARFSGTEQGFRSWVFTIAHHRMVDERRRSSRTPQIDHDADVAAHALSGDAEADALTVLDGDEISRLLSVLSPDQRDVLLLRIVADMSLADVATALGKRQGAIKALQHRGLATLRRHLERESASR
jgi:RNA polymerase sigma-70 factor (ECF subfamily)